MAVVSTITIGSVTYSVYALTADPVQDADDYHAALFGSDWSSLTTLQKQQALISAARLLDRAVLWSGGKTSAAQALQWPRDGATNGCTGSDVADGTTPDDIATGEFELAGLIASTPSLLNAASTGTNTKRVKAGSAEVEFFSPTIGTDDETRLPQAVHDLVSCYADDASGVLPSSGSLSSGTGDESAFDDSDDDYPYSRSEGFA